MLTKALSSHKRSLDAVICGVLCALLLVGLAFLTQTDVGAATVTASGTCGDNLTWELDDEGTLTISGSGEMDDYVADTRPWYSYCSNIKSIVIADGVTSIGNCAFLNCSDLTSVTIPDSVTRIGEYAFDTCSNLTNVTISKGITSIGYRAFRDCTVLKEIKFNAVAMNDLSANNYVFYNAGINGDGIKVIIGKDVTKVPAYLFSPYSYSKSYSPKITSVGFEEGSVCESIGNVAFSLCNSLTSVTIGNNVTSIGDSAFEYCDSLTSITIPNSVTTIGMNAFQYCSSIASINISDLSSWCVISFANMSSNPLCTTNSAKKLYLNGTSVTELTIPKGVTSIGNYALYNYSSLTSVTIPDTVTSIGNSAFYCCNYIRLVVVNSASIASSITASAKCGDIASTTKTVAVRSNITTIGRYITSNFKNVNTFNIDGVEYSVYSKHTHGEGDANWTVSEGGDKVCSQCGLNIPAPAPAKTEGYCGNNVRWAFDDETSTLTITGKGSMKGYSATSMPWYAYASQIKKVVIGEGVTSIGKNAFNNEKAGFVFPEISLPSTLTSIGRYAFYNCSGLTDITVPASVDTIGRFAFRGTVLTNYTIGRCGKTADWMLDENGTLIIYGDGAMYDFGSKNAPWASYKAQIKSVVICEGVTNIGNCAFYECASIESVKLASTVTSIGNYAFYSCKGLTEITVPASVTSIGAYAFRKCTALTTATFESDGWSYGDASADISADALKTNYKSAWTRA